MNVDDKRRITSGQAQEIWKEAFDQLQRELNRGTFDTWLRGATLLACEGGTFVIGVPHAYARDWLENRLHSAVKRILSGLAGHTVEVSFAVEAPIPQPAKAAQELDATPGADLPAYPSETNLNAKYMFETFVVGPSNRMAYGACQAVADNPARVYNPVFLYGGVGLGKTHLLQAVGNACVGRGLRVLYASSEEFTNDLITSIQKRTTEAFRGKYRRMDVLLIDDIQFIAGKESTQEEFFHTFHALHGQNKQVVMSSDRPPQAMVTLEDRLRSRFEWGLTVDIQPPDFETRQAVLRSKANRAGRQVDSAVIDLIARRIQSNIRELEGALNRVMAYADLLEQPVTLDIANSALADLLPRRRLLTALQVLQTVADHFKATFEALTGRERTKEIVWARQVAMYLIREETEASLPTIGEILERDHTTVMYGCDKVAELVERDDAVRKEMIAIRERLYQEG